jgi:hypothetical protein
MSTPAHRQAAYRRRQRDGRCVLLVEVDEVALEVLLVRAGLLSPGVEHDREALSAALARQIDLLAALEE